MAAKNDYEPAYPLNLETGSTEKPLSAFQKIKAEFERVYRLVSSALATANDLTSQSDTLIEKAETMLNTAVTNVSADATAIKQTKGNGAISTVLTIDTSISTASTNPVQNKVIANKLADLQSGIDELSRVYTALAARVSATEAAINNSSGSGNTGEHGCPGK